MSEDALSESGQRSARHIFLERRGYRQRRFVDAARLLPIVGLLLWLVPLVWPQSGDEGALSTSNATLFVFAIWFGLIVLGAFLAWKMVPRSNSVVPEDTSAQSGSSARGPGA